MSDATIPAAGELRAQLLCLVNTKADDWCSTTTLQCLLDSDVPRSRVLTVLHGLLAEGLVNHKRDKASDMWMQVSAEAKPVSTAPTAPSPAPVSDAPSARISTSAKVVRNALHHAGIAGATVQDLVDATGLPQANVYNALSDLRRKDHAITIKTASERTPRHYAAGFEPAARKERALAREGMTPAPSAAVVMGSREGTAVAYGSVRLCRWSTGELVIRRGEIELELDRREAELLRAFMTALPSGATS